MLKESVKMSWQNIVHNKMRSFLTILGIVIGVTAIIALITIVQGVTDEMTNRFAELGAGKVTVTAQGTLLKSGLSDNDIKELAAIDNVSGVSPTLSFSGSAVENGKVQDGISIEGKNEVYFENIKGLIERGRPLTLLDMESKNKVCLIDTKLQNKLFFGEDPLGRNIKLNGITFQIVGVLAEDSMDVMGQIMGGGNDGKAIIPYRTAMSMTGVNNINTLEVYISDLQYTNDVVEDAEAILNRAFNYKEKTYNIINLEGLIDTMNTMTSMMTATLAGIASIALLVGGIGIMNMMLVSVTERKMEIGLRKALGAEPKRIQLQFLIEAIFLSLLGGIIGVILGLSISLAACLAIGIPFSLYSSAIALGVGFSAIVGIVFGWAPARQASRLNPIDALRSM